jgi:hypothetical protein
MPCNGTLTATFENPTPGLPTTDGGNTMLNIIVLATSAVFAAVGSMYLVRNYRKQA